MGMRLELTFARPLSLEQQRRCLMALAGLAGSRRLRFLQGGFRAELLGEALDAGSVRQLLAEEKLPVEALDDGATPPEAASTEAASRDAGKERFRPLGR